MVELLCPCYQGFDRDSFGIEEVVRHDLVDFDTWLEERLMGSFKFKRVHVVGYFYEGNWDQDPLVGQEAFPFLVPCFGIQDQEVPSCFDSLDCQDSSRLVDQIILVDRSYIIMAGLDIYFEDLIQEAAQAYLEQDHCYKFIEGLDDSQAFCFDCSCVEEAYVEHLGLDWTQVH